jgi:hypothetical protein
VAAKTALNAKNLEALGPERLAQLLMEISTGDAAVKRRLRFELAGAQSPGELAREVRKRLTAIARSRSFVDWQGVRSLADDLDTQRRAIVETVAQVNPKEALDLLWRFMALGSSVFERFNALRQRRALRPAGKLGDLVQHVPARESRSISATSAIRRGRAGYGRADGRAQA